MIVYLLISIGFIYLIVQVVLIALRHHKAHKFFEKRSRNLPVLPNVNLFSGNMYQIMFNPKNAKYIDKMHKELGDSFGMYYGDFPGVFTKDLDLLKLIEIDEGYKHINKSPFYLPLKEYRDSLLQTRDEIWHRSRRVIGPALTNNKVRSDEVSDDIRNIVFRLHDALEMRMNRAEEQTGKRSIELNLEDMFDRYTMSVIFSIAYRQDNIIDFHADEDKLVRSFSVGKRDGDSKLLGLPVIFPFLRPLSYFLYSFTKFAKMRDNINGYMEKIIAQRRGAKKKGLLDTKVEGAYQRRFVDSILDAYFEKKITRDDLMGNMWGILFAGYVTTADTMVCLLWHLARSPEIQNKLRKTITEEGIDADYVQWCIYESVRWHPAAPLGIGRELKEDVTVNGVLYPAGTYIMASTPAIHRDPKIWPNPNEFQPERWAQRKSFHPTAFMGFGQGPRNCPGANLAVQEIKIALEMLLMNYEVRKCAKTVEVYNFSSPLMFLAYVDDPIILRFDPLRK